MQLPLDVLIYVLAGFSVICIGAMVLCIISSYSEDCADPVTHAIEQTEPNQSV